MVRPHILKKILIGCLFLASVLVVGCKKDAEVKAVLGELDSFTKELVQKVEATQGSAEGLEAAQQFLDSKKNDLKKKLEVLKGVRGFQISEATKKTMTDGFAKNATEVMSLQIRYARNARDVNYKTKLEKLVTDYRNLLTA
jgi:vacuolar-type H+-ATPase subunit I/STV1